MGANDARGQGRLVSREGGGLAITFSVASGIHAYPNLAITCEATGYEDFFLNGTVTETSINATVTGSGFLGEVVVLARR